MPNELPFYEKTVLSTPDPIHSSSMTSRSYIRKILDLNDIPERDSIPGRDSDVDSSFGILSIKSDDYRLSDAALHRQKEREKALNSLENFNKYSDLTSVPSQFLKPSEFSAHSLISNGILSESTISETDLLFGSSSTPRSSLLPEDFVMRRHRESVGLTTLANSVKNTGLSLDKIFGNAIQKTMDMDESFQSGAEALAKLEEDEMSWRREQNIPAQIQDFSVSSSAQDKMSMGSFFQRRSDDLVNQLPKSPQKSQPPVPLIEESVCGPDSKKCVDESLGISDIQNILQSDDTTNHALDKLLKIKPSSNPPNPVQSEPINELNKSEPTKDDDSSSDSFDEAIKENVSPDFNHEKSSLSSRCSSSLGTLVNGKLPIATTRTELIWSCVKIGRTSSYDFIIRNRSAHRLGVLCTVSNPAYRLNKEGSEANFSGVVKLILHPNELRTLTVTFAPTALGAAVDNLNFTPMDATQKQTVKQFIRLYGYGGRGNVTIHRIARDITGKYLLSLGNMDETQEMKQSFVIKNNESLPAFAYCSFISNGLHSYSNVNVHPKAVVLLPEEEKEILVTYDLQKTDFNYFKSSKTNNSVIDIGKLQMIHGTEVDRSRLRKMALKAKEKGQTIKSYVMNLIDKFPGEVVPNDLKLFRESISSIEEVLRFFNNEDIIVTLEQDTDQTLVAHLQDESTMFQSLCENTKSENTTYKETCQIEPTRVILAPPDKVRDKILLTNVSEKTLYFEVCTLPEGILMRPTDGTIQPGETSAIDLQYTKNCDKTFQKVRILVDHDSFEVDIKIVYVGKPML